MTEGRLQDLQERAEGWQDGDPSDTLALIAEVRRLRTQIACVRVLCEEELTGNFAGAEYCADMSKPVLLGLVLKMLKP